MFVQRFIYLSVFAIAGALMVQPDGWAKKRATKSMPYAELDILTGREIYSAFSECLTNDSVEQSLRLAIPANEIRKFAGRKDKSFPIKDKYFKWMFRQFQKSQKDGTYPHIVFPFQRSFACPNLDNGHLLKSGIVCRFTDNNRKSDMISLEVNGTQATYCSTGADGGEDPPPPCLHASNTPNLSWV